MNSIHPFYAQAGEDFLKPQDSIKEEEPDVESIISSTQPMQKNYEPKKGGEKIHPFYQNASSSESISKKENSEELYDQNQPSIGPLGTFLTGVAKIATFPLDLAKFVIQGNVAAGLMETKKNREGETYSPEEAREISENSLKYFPTEELAEKGLEHATGVRFEAKTKAEKAAHFAGSITSPKGLVEAGVKGGIKALLKTLGTKAAATISGTATKEGLDVLGVHPVASILLGASVGSLGEAGINALSQEGKALKETAKKYSLYEGSYVKRDGEFFKGAITKSQEKAVKKQIGVTSKEAIEKIVQEKHPISLLRKQGIDLPEHAENMLNEAEKEAARVEKPISMKPVVQAFDQRISEIRKSTHHLSLQDEKEIEILSSMRDSFVEKKPLSKETGLVDQHGKLFKEKAKEDVAKDSSATMLTKQYRKNNQDRKDFYKNPTMGNLAIAADRAYSFANKELVKAAETSGASKYVEKLTASNNVFHQVSNLRQTETILRPFFEDLKPSTLNRILNSDRKVGFLNRTLGKEGVGQLQEIGKYTKIAEKKLAEHFLVSGDNYIDIMKKVGTASLVALVNPTAAAAMDIGIGAMYIKGMILTHPKLRAEYLNFAKAMASGSEKAIKITSTKLNESFKNEYGDVEDILNNPEKLERV